ncbi:MAG TPA: glycogen debranching N-terminal domain-containing protein [Candidatus Dormibacteraeota bacterium]|nr:glycogen debranching N-terminal domain-containing protein [Candidatus Dormibacteraeota bacterium]
MIGGTPPNTDLGGGIVELDLARTLMIKRGSLIALSGPDGAMDSDSSREHGLYFHDTRFLDCATLRVEGSRPSSLGATDGAGDRTVSELVNPDLRLADGTTLERGQLRLRRERVLDGRMAERLTVRSFATREVEVRLELAYGADFATLFAVRGAPPARRGVLHAPAWRDGSLELRYDGADGRRRTTTFQFHPEPDQRDVGRAGWRVRLRPGGEATIQIVADVRDRGPGRLEAAPAPVMLGPLSEARVESDSAALEQAFRRSLHDLALLAMRELRATFFAAGVPWFVALFGRDSLVTALQTLAFDPGIAATTLQLLAAYQGRSRDPWRDEEPGKILHELRVGEDANLGEIPHTPYYGTVDATPLFVALVAEYVRWTGDLRLWRRLRPNVERALAWMALADHDGDGFVDYERQSARGLSNQGWKDSHDSVINRDGSLAEAPIALVEVQGYVYRALRGTAWLWRLEGQPERAAELDERADALRRRLDAAYWLPRRRFLAMALGAGGRPADVVASNPGHALWSGVVEPSRAGYVAERLLGRGLFSGWGVRTLAQGEARYDPVGYHTGAVWPHDNSLVVAGLARSGFTEAAVRLFGAQLDAAARLPGHRLPEAFSGRARGRAGAPLPYPSACIPQAWASGAVPFMLTETLGLVPDAPNGRLTVRRPALPPGVGSVTLRGVKLAGASLDLRFARDGRRVRAEVVRQTGTATVTVEP